MCWQGKFFLNVPFKASGLKAFCFGNCRLSQTDDAGHSEVSCALGLGATPGRQRRPSSCLPFPSPDNGAADVLNRRLETETDERAAQTHSSIRRNAQLVLDRVACFPLKVQGGPAFLESASPGGTSRLDCCNYALWGTSLEDCSEMAVGSESGHAVMNLCKSYSSP